MTDWIARLNKQLHIEEGCKLQLYHDTKGIVTIGVGRNIQTNGIRPDEAELMLKNDIGDADKFFAAYAWYNTLDEVRKAAIIDLAFMGPEKVLHFIDMIYALKKRDYESAHLEVIDSKWYRDVGQTRGDRVANMVKTGTWPKDIPE